MDDPLSAAKGILLACIVSAFLYLLGGMLLVIIGGQL